MRKSEELDTEPNDFIFSDEDLDLEIDEYEKSGDKVIIKRGIEDYFERKEMESLDDWFDDL
ncbi:MAG: hypothetical protein OQK12_10240 [Motiliproteus sp.]|nr:hypothetical protein [Motiliproteus sp.]MCW9050980.1 hypothetical protein [Motiliproteus sp.]